MEKRWLFSSSPSFGRRLLSRRRCRGRARPENRRPSSPLSELALAPTPTELLAAKTAVVALSNWVVRWRASYGRFV